MAKRISLLLAIILLAFLAAWQLRGEEPPAQSPSWNPFQLDSSIGKFKEVSPSRKLEFPADLGPHPEYALEWWYYTGNLETEGGDHFGYQLTFFRLGLASAAAQTAARDSRWGFDQLYFAHFTLTDVGSETFVSFERFSRGVPELAGAQAEPFQVWLENWRVEQVSAGQYRLSASRADFEIELLLEDRKGITLQGKDGYSQKGPAASNASMYFSQTRLASQGTVTIRGQSYPVSGTSWMDHEFTSSLLSEDQIGWDWFGLQFDDGSELMVGQLRRADGSVDPFSAGVFVPPEGDAVHLQAGDFQILVMDTWQSPRSGASYPSAWDLEVPGLGLSIAVEPYLADQELNVSTTYWEGAVRISGSRAQQRLAGWGYVELTGYQVDK